MMQIAAYNVRCTILLRKKFIRGRVDSSVDCRWDKKPFTFVSFLGWDLIIVEG